MFRKEMKNIVKKFELDSKAGEGIKTIEDLNKAIKEKVKKLTNEIGKIRRSNEENSSKNKKIEKIVKEIAILESKII